MTAFASPFALAGAALRGARSGAKEARRAARDQRTAFAVTRVRSMASVATRTVLTIGGLVAFNVAAFRFESLLGWAVLGVSAWYLELLLRPERTDERG